MLFISRLSLVWLVILPVTVLIAETKLGMVGDISCNCPDRSWLCCSLAD